MMLMRFRPCSGESARMPTAQWMISFSLYQRCARFLQRDAGARSVHMGDAVAADDDAVGLRIVSPVALLLQVVPSTRLRPANRKFIARRLSRMQFPT